MNAADSRALIQPALANDAANQQAPASALPWAAKNPLQAEATSGRTHDGSPRLPLGICSVPVLAGDGSTSGNMRAPHTRFNNGRSIYLITAAELAANGLGNGASPTGIGWTYTAAPGTGGTGTLVVYLENTTDTTNTKSTTWATAITGMTVVSNSSQTLPAVSGAFDLVFSGGSPFTYTGGGLYVAFDWQYTGTLSTTTVVSCNTALTGGLKGAQSNVAPPTTIAASNFRPETRLTANVADNDAGSDFVMTYGEVPMGLVDPFNIFSNVTNHGSTMINNLNVTINVTGANTFTDTQVVPGLNVCGGTDYAIYLPFAPTVLGTNTVSASVPPDDVNTNNTSPSFRLDTTVNRYNYKEPGSSSVPGGVGVAGNTAILAAKFTVNVATQVDSVTLDFPTLNATTYRLVIYGNNGNGLPGAAPLYRDAADRTIGVAGPRTIRLPAPVSVGPGDFFVGADQTNTTNMGLGFANENPIRSGSFVGAIPDTSTAWFDLSPGANFKLNLGAILGRCLVPMTTDVTPNGTSSVCPNTAIQFTATPTGGTGTKTFQWTENGIDIPGATNSTYNATKAAAGTFTYNCKITDDGGCIDTVDAASSTGNWSAPSVATVSGDNAICLAGSANIQAALTGIGPWNVTWSDGFVQNGVVTSPATRSVSPAATTVYTVTAVTDACGAGTATGSATVTVDAAPPASVGNSLTAGKSGGNNTLGWSAGAGAAFYNVKRCTFTTAYCLPTVVAATPTGTAYSEADDANSYMYAVESVNGCGIVPLTR